MIHNGGTHSEGHVVPASASTDRAAAEALVSRFNAWVASRPECFGDLDYRKCERWLIANPPPVDPLTFRNDRVWWDSWSYCDWSDRLYYSRADGRPMAFLVEVPEIKP